VLNSLGGSSSPVRAPDIAELETLVLCAAEGSLVGAAGRLGISRPAVAKRIGNLEALAGRRLLDRGGRGVRLTDAGATLLAGARRMLDERDVLLSLLGDIRGEGPSAIAGLRELLGHAPEASRAAQQPEARLAETERVLELVLRASATGVVVSDPETAVVHEVNDAFCRFTGRTRAELLSRSTTEIGVWQDSTERERLIKQLRTTGAVERALVRVRRPDGTVRVGETTAHFVALAGTRRLLSTTDDVTERHQLDAERAASVTAYRAVTRVAALVLAGQPMIESLASILPQLRSSGGFATALLWDLNFRRPHVIDGRQPPGELEQGLQRGRPLPGGEVVRLAAMSTESGPGSGWAVPLPCISQSLILLGAESQPASMQALFAGVLADLATLAGSHA
jgi:PAS domain S-box-containing protein